jgi:hypothetical protein
MKYIVYWYDKEIEDYSSRHYTYFSEELEDIETAKSLCRQLWSNQTVMVIKDLDGNIIEVLK